MLRVRATEADVPIRTDINVTMIATSKLTANASNQELLLNKLSYHFNEYPGGGNSRYRDLLKEIITITIIGIMRYNATIIADSVGKYLSQLKYLNFIFQFL